MTGKELDNENVLFQQVATGDAGAFHVIFHHYNALLLPFVIKLTSSPETAREVIQEIFMDVWRQREKLVAINNYRAWLYSIASNKAIDYLRRQAAEGRLLSRLQSTAASSPDAPDNTLIGKEMAHLVEQAIESLPPAQRQVYRLSREQNLSIAEIAALQGTSPNTVKNQLVTALKAVKLFLERFIYLLLPWLYFFFKFFLFPIVLNHLCCD